MLDILIALILAFSAVVSAQLDRGASERRERPSVQRSVVRSVTEAAPKKVVQIDCDQRARLQSA